jgi:hypothetical protein
MSIKTTNIAKKKVFEMSCHYYDIIKTSFLLLFTENLREKFKHFEKKMIWVFLFYLSHLNKIKIIFFFFGGGFCVCLVSSQREKNEFFR